MPDDQTASRAGAPTSVIESAVALHRAGRIEPAADAYRKILEQYPDDPHATHLLGVVALQSGRLEEAVQRLRRAIELLPNVGVYHLNLACALQSQRRTDEAIAEAERAILLDPRSAARGYHVAALAFADVAQPEDAVYCLQKAVEAQPEYVGGYLLLSAMLDRLARTPEARESRDRAVAVAQVRCEREPGSAEAQLELARALDASGQMEPALSAYRAASRIAPDDPTILHALATSLRRAGKRDEAMMCLRVALRSSPNIGEIRVALGQLLDEQGDPAAAARELRAAVEQMADHPAAQVSLAGALLHGGEADPAVEILRRAVELAPTVAPIHDALLRAMHYSARIAPQEIFEQHVAWSRRHAEPLVREADSADAAATPDRDPDRPLRIGIVSAGLAEEPLAQFLTPLLAHRDRTDFPVICYCDLHPLGDALTALETQVDQWWKVGGFSDAQLAKKIREDRIDVLIDLAGHTRGHRLLALARRPAPVQMTQFGYPDTTGLSAFDYRVTDEFTDPPKATEQWSVEKLARLPRLAWCYIPPQKAPEAGAPPSGTSRPVTFGCVAPAAAVSPEAIATWSRVLEALAGSRLLVLLDHRDADHGRELLRRGGLDPARVTVLPRRADSRQYIDLFNAIDILLDPFPFTASTAVCDAMWMGVPVVALAGQTQWSRQGVGALSAGGLSDLAAGTMDEYVRIAVALAEDRERLAELRWKLRERMHDSALLDHAGWTRAMQDLWRSKWRERCDGG